MKYDYDLVVIGAGSAGLVAAKLGKGLGKKVAIIEKNKIGGECTWTGCIPSKALIKSARVAHQAQFGEKYGLSNAKLDSSHVMDHVREVIKEIYAEETPEVIEEEGIDVISGGAEFLSANHIKVGDKTIAAKKFVIATGSSPFVPPIEGIDSVSYLTNETLFDLKALPKSMLILGGGAIGAEMASALNRLGVAVTIIEMQERILAKEDAELAQILQDHLLAEGVKILTNTKATRVTQSGDTITMTCEGDATQNVSAESLLVAVGRKPNIEGLALENAGVKYDRSGITVDDTLRTSAETIYACGDAAGPYLFTHMARQQGMIAARNALVPFFKKKIRYNNVPWVTFTDPECAVSGMTEEAARAKYGERIQVFRVRYEQVDRAHTDRELLGMLKVICDTYGKILGMHLLGARAGEVLGELHLGKVLGVPLHKLLGVIRSYPTYNDAIRNVAQQAYVSRIRNNFFVQLYQKVFGARK